MAKKKNTSKRTAQRAPSNTQNNSAGLNKKQRKRRDKKPIGMTLQTRDEYFEEEQNYRKPGYETKGNYRKVVVLDSHNGNLIVAKMTKTGKNAQSLIDEKVSKYKPNLHIEIKDDNGNFIKPNAKFIPNGKNKNLTRRDVNIMKKVAFSGDSERAQGNRKKAREIKNR